MRGNASASDKGLVRMLQYLKSRGGNTMIRENLFRFAFV